MLENNADMLPGHGNGKNDAASYLQQAADACASGDPVLGMHLYLAAYEQSQRGADEPPSDEALRGLKKAWALACKLKERSIAEYVFERIEPHLAEDERSRYVKQLQELALDKLEQYGLDRAGLEEMAEAISQDFLEGEPACMVQVGRMSGPGPRAGKGKDASGEGIRKGGAAAGRAGQARQGGLPAAKQDAEGRSMAPAEFGTYKDLVGFDEAIGRMHKMGLGMDRDPEFQRLVSLLNDRHGLDGMPAIDSLLFRSPAREDANRFMMATAGELGLPVLRMRMEENVQGMPMLCVMAQSDRQPKLNHAHNAFEGAGVLLLEDLDTWVSPLSDQMSDDFGGFLMASLSRGAREAVNLIRSAVENPDVYVLASSGDLCDADPFFCDLLAPLSVVDIDYPTDAERTDIWMDIARSHPSMRGLDRALLVRYSRAMPRYDIYMAAREAIEQTYKASLVERRYAPVKPDNIFDKLAAYQPLDSEEYQALENAVVEDFRRDLDNIDELLLGDE